MLSGNPKSNNIGWVGVRLDDKWETRQSSSHFAAVMAATWPLVRRYNYPAVLAAGRDARRAAGNGEAEAA